MLRQATLGGGGGSNTLAALEGILIDERLVPNESTQGHADCRESPEPGQTAGADGDLAGTFWPSRQQAEGGQVIGRRRYCCAPPAPRPLQMTAWEKNGAVLGGANGEGFPLPSPLVPLLPKSDLREM